MSMRMAYGMWKRQNNPFNGDDDHEDNDNDGYRDYDGDYNWWWTGAGMAVRYGIVAILFASILIFFVGGYYHAKRRINKGQEPLAYHRWMIRRPNYNPPQQPRYYYDPNSQGYNMEGYPPPPPAYHHSEAPPPTYQPPEGASKAMADQNYSTPNAAGEGSASSGPAPPAPVAR